jgi:ABC-2 type transport system permease protein
MALAAVAVGNLLNFLIVWGVQSVAFWADNVWSLMVAHRFVSAILGGVMVPLSLFPEPLQRACAVLPYRACFALPAETLLGRAGPAEWGKGMAIALAWCLAVGIAGRLVWRRGDRQYTGVGM